MWNHFHLLVETLGANLNRFMHKLETAYVVYFNLRHERVGHLMQGRYGAQLVQGDEYLLKLSRYIHLNPVFVSALRSAALAERLQALQAYRWSSYRQYVGLDPTLSCLQTEPLLHLVGGSADDKPERYRQFVETGLASSDEQFRSLLKSSRWSVGDPDFQEFVLGLYEDQQRDARRLQDAAFRRIQVLKSVEEVLQAVGSALGVGIEELRHQRHRGYARAAAARMLWVYAGLNQSEIGRELAIGTGAAVCQQLRKLEAARARDQDLDRRLHRLEKSLSSCA